MQIQVNTGSQTQGSADWTNDIETLIEEKFSRFADRITRTEVHLNDENSASKEGGKDKRCQIEVRIAGMQPISVTDHADSHELALHGAADQMVRLIETTVGKLGTPLRMESLFITVIGSSVSSALHSQSRTPN